MNNIDRFNINVCEMLTKSKPAVRQPKGSKPFHFPECKVKSTTVADLRMHLKSSHSKTENKKRVKMNTKMILNEDLSLLNDSESSITTLDEHPEESVQPPVIKIVDEVVVHKDEEKVQSINKKCGLETIDDCVNPTIINIDSKGKEGDSLLTDESFNCGICSETFETKSNYILHMQSHQEPSTFKCDKCGKSFNKQLELEWNTETEHEQQLSSNHQLPESNEEVTKTDHNDVEMQPLSSCELCDYDTENINDLRNHVQRNVHSFKNNSFQEIVDIDVPGEVYICGEYCAKFETFQACESHTNNHLSKYTNVISSRMI